MLMMDVNDGATEGYCRIMSAYGNPHECSERFNGKACVW